MTDSTADVSDISTDTTIVVTETFGTIDKNVDGMISVEEAQGSASLTDGFGIG